MSGDTTLNPAPRAQSDTRRKMRHRGNGLFWILPALVLSVGLIYYSIGYTLYVSTLKWDGFSPNPEFVGADNYAQALNDPVFWMAIGHTLLSFIVTFSFQVAIGVTLAALLHSNPWFGGVYRVLVFIPVILAPAITAPVFRQIFAPDGQLNAILEVIGLGEFAQPWLAQTSTALPMLMIIMIWHGAGLSFILYYAAMSQIEPEVLEAAELDGAGNFRKMISIIWPSVRGTTIVLATLNAIASLKAFDIPYLVTAGGPNFATEYLGTMIYRISIRLTQVGYGAALSVLLLIMALVIGIVLNSRRINGKRGQ
ncbi:carbohydrate ABC transporter permease [Populibacterium corticicola]|uniref:Carbohydrate ABC transporter permease n=1 Tax=Populibacterium corticicola TaxID=1812826 RepID=A0ABW5XFH8_9MICO